MNGSLENSKNNTSGLSQSRRLWMAMVLGTLAAFAPLSIDMYLPALPDIAKDLYTTPSLVQLSLTFFLFGLSFGQLLVGPISDVRGRRKPLLIGLIIYFVASLLCAFSQSIWGLIILRFIQGMAGSAGIVISRAIVRDMYSGSELTKFFSLLALINGVLLFSTHSRWTVIAFCPLARCVYGLKCNRFGYVFCCTLRFARNTPHDSRSREA